MQFALQDLRRWGYRKLLSDLSKEEFISLATTIVSENLGVRCSAFSFPRFWCDFRMKNAVEYKGMFVFTRFCEPLIDNIDVDVTCQRKFRNQWQSFCKSLSKDVGFTKDEENIISECGILMSFAVNRGEAYDKLINYFNAILCWYIFTQTESSISDISLSPNMLIESMMLMTSSEFLQYVLDLV